MRKTILAILIFSASITGCSDLAENVLSAPVQTVHTDIRPKKVRATVKVVRLGDLCYKVGSLATTDKGVRAKCVPRDGFRPRWKKYL